MTKQGLIELEGVLESRKANYFRNRKAAISARNVFKHTWETSHLDVDHEGPLWDEVPEDGVGEEHHESCERHEVGAVAGHHQDHYVHRHPQHERRPAKGMRETLLQI